MRKYQKIIIPFFLVDIVLGLFGWWGYFSVNGQKYFDEMDGMIPFFALCISIILFLGLLLIYLFSKLRSQANEIQ